MEHERKISMGNKVLSKKTVIITIVVLIFLFPIFMQYFGDNFWKENSTIKKFGTARSVFGKGNWILEYGVLDNELVYVVIAGNTLEPKKGVKGLITSRVNHDGSKKVIIKKPNGDEIILPSKKSFIFESINGKFRESSFQISLKELKSYLKSNNTGFSINSIKNNVLNYRKQ